jgi:hypothetical protein
MNYCLKALMDNCLANMKNFATFKNEFGYIYVLARTGMAEKAAITYRFMQHKMDEYENLKTELESLKTEVFKSGEQGTQTV